MKVSLARPRLSVTNSLAGPGTRGRQWVPVTSFAALLPISEHVLGPDHPDILVTRSSLAYWARLHSCKG
jgi:hypothetical protein